MAGTDAEFAAARGYFAYCGTYAVDDHRVTHYVALSLMSTWIGGEQRRHVALHRDKVTLSTPPTPVGAQRQSATLVWQRVDSRA